jgi:uncharacterized protein YbgA (DUF1722 family)/uncharacterized protein YbbK (DUF523 family)
LAEASERQLKSKPLRLGVSACLMGQLVRWNGGHKRDRYLLGTLGEFVEWIPICPEVEIGLGTPREPIRLVGDPESPRLIGPKSDSDFTEPMQAWSKKYLDQMQDLGLHGFVLKKDSPSCGLYRVKVYNQKDVPSRQGRGIFATELIKAYPLLPVEEEGRLHDMPLRENFLQRVFTYKRWQDLLENSPGPANLVKFHSAHKLTLMAHSPKHYKQLGQLVAQAGTLGWDQLVAEYGRGLMEGLSNLATRGKHVNVLQHLMGFLKDTLSAQEKQELLGLIEDYRQELVPLIVPLTLLKHQLNRHSVPDWVQHQVYLQPHPKELALLNHV